MEEGEAHMKLLDFVKGRGLLKVFLRLEILDKYEILDATITFTPAPSPYHWRCRNFPYLMVTAMEQYNSLMRAEGELSAGKLSTSEIKILSDIRLKAFVK